MRFTEKSQAAVELELSWESETASHAERILLPRGDLWRDVVHRQVAEGLAGGGTGTSLELAFPPGSVVPPYRHEDVHAVPVKAVRLPPPRCGEEFRFGRFYPRGFLSGSGLFFSEDVRPFRVTGRDGDWIVADCNHPLSPFPLTLAARILEVRKRGGMLGGSCRDWLEELTANGPGMEAPWKGKTTDFGGSEGMAREDERDDAAFYAPPRLVDHVDARASAFLREEYARRVPPGSRVLDLMSSASSHLPDDLDLTVTGLGLNAAELEHNPLLGERVVHDLNREPNLPFADGSFGAVTCSLSFEYLIRPDEVAAEVRRVLEPGGVFLVGLSNRWFPPKVTRVWKELHEFERMGMVAEHLQAAGLGGLSTLSVRNWPRPAEDRHYPGLRASDPVYVVSGVKRS